MIFFFLLFHFVFFLLFFTDVCSCSCLSWVSDIQLGLYHKKKTQTHQFILWAQKKEEKKEKSWKIIEPLQFENTSEQQTRNIFAVGTSVTWHIFLPSVFFFSGDGGLMPGISKHPHFQYMYPVNQSLGWMADTWWDVGLTCLFFSFQYFEPHYTT